LQKSLSPPNHPSPQNLLKKQQAGNESLNVTRSLLVVQTLSRLRVVPIFLFFFGLLFTNILFCGIIILPNKTE